MSVSSKRFLQVISSFVPDAATLADPTTPHLLLDGHEVLSVQGIPGVEVRADKDGEIAVAEIVVAPGAIVVPTIHTCIGFLQAREIQRLRIRVRIGEGASARLLAHCLFPNAEQAEHTMDAVVEVGANATLRYSEGHFHGPIGGIVVSPTLDVRVAEGAHYVSDFSLLQGGVGRLRIAQRIEVGANGVAEVTARVSARGHDDVRIEDELVLSGRASRGLVKTRVALADDARAAVIGITRGCAEGARGHMDCMELVRDRAVARAEPIVEVSHPLAKVTHEAAVGTVDQAQLETLLAHGLTPDEAIDLIVTGILR